MRMLVKVAATLVLGAFAVTASAHIDFVRAQFLSLEGGNERWVLKMVIHEWESGPKLERPLPVTLQFRRAPECVVSKLLYVGTNEEFEHALSFIRRYIEAGGLHRFGMNAMEVNNKRDAFLGVDLRVGHVDKQEPVVWTIKPETGLDLCPFKYDFDR